MSLLNKIAIGYGTAFLAILVFWMAAFLALLMTLVALYYMIKPAKDYARAPTPKEARAFIGRGLVGAILFVGFLALIDIMFFVPVNWNYVFQFAWTGYMAGSLGGEIVLELENPSAPQVLPPSQTIPPPRPPVLPPTPHQTFQYASWDDEEARR